MKKYFQHKQRIYLLFIYNSNRGRQCHYRMVAVFTTTYNLCDQSLSPLMLWVRISIRARRTTLCDKVCQWLATGRWFSPGPPISDSIINQFNSTTVLYLAFSLPTFSTPYIVGFFFVSNDLRWNVIVRFVDKVGFMVFIATFNNISVISWRI